MKKILLLALTLFVFSFAHAQNENTQDNQSDSTYHAKNILKMNPFSLLFLKSFNFQFEHSLKEKSTILLGVNFFQWNELFRENLSGVCVQLAYRMYFLKKDLAPEGVFISPIVELGAITSTLENSNSAPQKQHTLALSAGGRAGYQWIFESGVALDFYCGYSQYYFNFDTYSEKIKTPVAGISFGYKF